MPVCPKLALDAAASSHVGRRRRNNEDSFAALPHLGLFMVADGLGGEAAGEVASRMAIHIVQESLEEEDDPDETWPHGVSQARDRHELRLMMSVRRANQGILEASKRSPERRGMATTFAGVLFSPDAAYIAHVGDSRVYRFRDGRLERLTRDHTVLDDILAEARPSIEALIEVAHRGNAISRALGCAETVEVETRVEETVPGDIFLVCSDGLWGPVPERKIVEILGAHRELGTAASLLIDCANEFGGPDNVTCVLARVGGH
jgi:PPM family protein phosphatase